MPVLDTFEKISIGTINRFYNHPRGCATSSTTLFSLRSLCVFALHRFPGWPYSGSHSVSLTKRKPRFLNSGTAAITPLPVPASGWFICSITTSPGLTLRSALCTCSADQVAPASPSTEKPATC